ncbi:MAG: alpha-hydroxy-acid oxidizing protein [Candidatus Aminicenantes bacterium]|nr:alpha-hydroxy-acid oxidizing protein [Candidatus Aminicenantes bacterium]
MATYKCSVCDTVFDEKKEGKKWEDLTGDWACHVCESGKSLWSKVTERTSAQDVSEGVPAEASGTPDDYKRLADDFEGYMADIHEMAETGKSIIEPMRTRKSVPSWDDILIKGAQLAKTPLDHDAPVNTETVIGPRAKLPLVIATPIYVTHMSFGALSREAKLALAKGSAEMKTAMCSGEGGILPESVANAYRYIFEYVPNRYSATEENFKKIDAVEIKIGQSAKPGMGGHLPGNKVTKEIAEIRGFEEGKDIISPAHFKDIPTREALKAKVEWLREASEGKPIGIKFAAGNVEADLEVALFAEPDFITIDGRPGATGASPKYVKAATSVPTMFALYRARKYLDDHGIKDVTLLITGGFRISADFAKALALGADGIAVGTASLMAIGCQQYRICDTGKCPMGITTQNPELRARLDVEKSARGLANFFRASTEELKDFARLTGNDDVHKLSVGDLYTYSPVIAAHTSIEPV